jgi:hypothetical protein
MGIQLFRYDFWTHVLFRGFPECEYYVLWSYLSRVGKGRIFAMMDVLRYFRRFHYATHYPKKG